MISTTSVLMRTIFFAVILIFAPVHAAVVTFDDLAVIGQTTFGFDGDSDGINDVIFSTTDPAGFNVIGPGQNQNFIQEPGLAGTSELNPDLRVDLLNGANGPLSFGFALDSLVVDPAFFASFSVFDAGDNLLANSQQMGEFLPSPFGAGLTEYPEGEISVSFSGIATYAIFDFTSEFGNYIIDNFEGTFGSTETIVPVPAAVWLFGSALGILGWIKRRHQV